MYEYVASGEGERDKTFNRLQRHEGRRKRSSTYLHSFIFLHQFGYPSMISHHDPIRSMAVARGEEGGRKLGGGGGGVRRGWGAGGGRVDSSIPGVWGYRGGWGFQSTPIRCYPVQFNPIPSSFNAILLCIIPVPNFVLFGSYPGADIPGKVLSVADYPLYLQTLPSTGVKHPSAYRSMSSLPIGRTLTKKIRTTCRFKTYRY